MYGYYQNYNPYMQQQNMLPAQTVTRQEIVKVNGENGARAYQIAPNSSVLLLDEQSPIVWLKTTDGAGYPTITPYTITPYQTEQQIDISSLESRIKRLEDRLNESDITGSNATEQ